MVGQALPWRFEIDPYTNRHASESWHPSRHGLPWTPAFAGVTGERGGRAVVSGRDQVYPPWRGQSLPWRFAIDPYKPAPCVTTCRRAPASQCGRASDTLSGSRRPRGWHAVLNPVAVRNASGLHRSGRRSSLGRASQSASRMAWRGMSLSASTTATRRRTTCAALTMPSSTTCCSA